MTNIKEGLFLYKIKYYLNFITHRRGLHFEVGVIFMGLGSYNDIGGVLHVEVGGIFMGLGS